MSEMTERKAAEMALEALNIQTPLDRREFELRNSAIEALRQALRQALPQGVEEWIAEHGLQFVDTLGGYATKLKRSRESQYPWPEYVSVENLRAYLSGMAIVPVKPTEKMIAAALPQLMREDDEDKHRALGQLICVWDALIDAAKEEGK